MTSKEHFWNILVLNCSITEGETLSSSLKDTGFNIDTVSAISIENLEEEIVNRSWDIVIGVDDVSSTASLKKALENHNKCDDYRRVPFVILAENDSCASRVDWMSSGACDVVGNGNIELLALVMDREFMHLFDTPNVSIKRVSRESFDENVEQVLHDPAAREKVTLFAIKFHHWEKHHRSFDERQSAIFDTAIDKELYSLFGHQKHIISPDGVAMFLASPSSVTQAAHSLGSTFDKLFIDIDDKSFQVTISSAILELRYFDTDKEQLFNKIDDLLTHASDKGLNKFEIYHPDTELERQAAEGDAMAMVQHALENKKLELLFQPVASLHGGDSEEIYEVLVQLVDPEEKKIPANQFINAIDKTHLAEKMDRWIILQSVKLILKRSKERSEADGGSNSGEPWIRLLVHICAASMHDEKFLMWLFLLVKKTGIDPASLVFLIGEENVARYSKETENLIIGVEKMGCRTGICHFGSTINPMGIAEEFTTDYIKFAGKLTEDLVENSGQEKKIKTMVDKLHTLGRKTIIPRIENPRVLTKAWRTGSDYIQGHFLQGPEPHMNYDFRSEF